MHLCARCHAWLFLCVITSNPWNSPVRRPWLLLAHYGVWAPESEVPCPWPQLGSGRARGQAQVCLLDFKSLISSLHLCAAPCCIWLLYPWLCSVFVCWDIACSQGSSIPSLQSAFIEHLLCPMHFGVTKISKMMVSDIEVLRSVKGCRPLQMRRSLQQQTHVGTEVPEKRE